VVIAPKAGKVLGVVEYDRLATESGVVPCAPSPVRTWVLWTLRLPPRGLDPKVLINSGLTIIIDDGDGDL